MSDEKQFCEHCGHQLPQDSQFCENCGRAIAKPQIPNPQPPQSYRPAQQSPKGSKKGLALGVAGILIVGFVLCLAAGAAGFYLYRRYAKNNPTPVTSLPVVEPAITSSQAPLPAHADTPTPEASATLQPAPATELPTPVLPTTTLTPVKPVETINEFTFASHGVTFNYDPSLASDFDINLVAEQSGNNVPEWEALPEHLELVLRGYPQTESDLEAHILIFPVEDLYRVNPSIGEMHATLQQMLMMRTYDNLPDPLPFFPFWNAGQIMAIKVAYLDFANGSGVRYLTQYAQNIDPINNQRLFYTFQGLTGDGKYLISAVLPVSISILPDPQLLMSDPTFIDIYPDYLESIKLDLNEQEDFYFMPDLSLLDAMFQSLLVE